MRKTSGFVFDAQLVEPEVENTDAGGTSQEFKVGGG